mmetsp:Transcript_55279/g.165666  ORF Transcript_55279/g.165666 Transcript_55279/m.165666 type:complete len:223 (-) Transcript_55279:749-1417(-)
MTSFCASSASCTTSLSDSCFDDPTTDSCSPPPSSCCAGVPLSNAMLSSSVKGLTVILIMTSFTAQALSKEGRPTANGTFRIRSSSLGKNFLTSASSCRLFLIVLGQDNSIIAASSICDLHPRRLDLISSRNLISPARRSWAPIDFALPLDESIDDWAPPCPRRTVYCVQTLCATHLSPLKTAPAKRPLLKSKTTTALPSAEISSDTSRPILHTERNDQSVFP